MAAMNGIERAIAYFGGLAALARALELSGYQVAQQWRASGHVPPKYCPRIERLTNREIRCEELDSTVDWAFVREYCCTNSETSQRGSRADIG
ncbi:Cro/CI family transcriptional regulator [Cupriavidus oxalaticus]|uniref:Cro/CI family transcriptional regulator n=1 Tax=Cupriavidus oxalaticus TaxID=96344 RepID=UPI003F73E52B